MGGKERSSLMLIFEGSLHGMMDLTLDRLYFYMFIYLSIFGFCFLYIWVPRIQLVAASASLSGGALRLRSRRAT